MAAKHGLAGLTKTVALELATSGVTANCISPGYVSTPLVERQIPDTMKARNMTREQVINDVMLAAQPTKQFVSVDQVAAVAVFLCSDAGADHGATCRSTAVDRGRERRCDCTGGCVLDRVSDLGLFLHARDEPARLHRMDNIHICYSYRA